MSQSPILTIIEASIKAKQLMLADEEYTQRIDLVVHMMIDCFKTGGRILLCGNGGSAADAQHIAAELSGRFYLDREPLDAEALHVNTSYLTAVANDYGFDQVYERLVRAKGRAGDVLIAISTSGNSKNILLAAAAGKSVGMAVVGMTGKSGGHMEDACDVVINVPTDDTPRIQECHILIGHILCELVEKAMA
jgi:D-sedoheptulose 7-phosphate isomerase